MNILIVDDDPFVQKTLSFYLMEAGHQLSIASDGQKAVEMLEKNRQIDVLVCDIHMPVLTGPSLILTLKKLFPTNPPVVIIISGIRDGRNFLKKIEIKHDYYFEKPLNFEEFLDCIREIEKKRN